MFFFQFVLPVAFEYVTKCSSWTLQQNAWNCNQRLRRRRRSLEGDGILVVSVEPGYPGHQPIHHVTTCYLLPGKKRMKYYSSYRPTLNHSTFCLIAEDLDDWTNGQCFRKTWLPISCSWLFLWTLHFLLVELTSVFSVMMMTILQNALYMLMMKKQMTNSLVQSCHPVICDGRTLFGSARLPDHDLQGFVISPLVIPYLAFFICNLA